MRFDPTRREFLGTAGAAGAALGSSPSALAAAITTEPARRPQVAAVCTTYFYLSHAYHIVGRFLDGFVIHDARGEVLHKPNFDIASLFIDQTPTATDLGLATAKRHNVPVFGTIAEALTLGTDKLAVDAVLLVGEHGDYPLNAKGQKLYPRGKFFNRICDVFEKSGQSVPVFNDKHLSYDRREGLAMVARAHKLKAPFMAGSSLPVTWRQPELEIPLGRPMSEALVVSHGSFELFGFHALETLQCMTERRDRKGKPQGVAAVTCLVGDAVWHAGEQGVWSRELLDAALSRATSRNIGDMKQNCRDYHIPKNADASMVSGPIAFVVDYVDGLRATVLLLDGHVADTTVAVRLGGVAPSIVSTLVYLPLPPGARFFDPLVLRIEEFFRNGKPRYPVERTLLTGGILDAAHDSRALNGKRLATPELASIDYVAPADSGFMRAPLGGIQANRM